MGTFVAAAAAGAAAEAAAGAGAAGGGALWPFDCADAELVASRSAPLPFLFRSKLIREENPLLPVNLGLLAAAVGDHAAAAIDASAAEINSSSLCAPDRESGSREP